MKEKQNLKKEENLRVIERRLVNTYIRRREKEIHKGNCGAVLLIAGSLGMTGAAVLCARAALRTGAGLCRVSIPEELFPIIQIGIPEATCVSRSLESEFLMEHQAIVIGPGLGVRDDDAEWIKRILETYPGPVVLDADGLNLLAAHEDIAASAVSQIILTPHPGEAGRLLHRTAAEIQRDRKNAAQELSERFSAIAVLKGAGTIVAAKGKTAYINMTGNPGMATGGAGDVLSGVIGALAGQGLSPETAACCGVYLHGLAGDLAAAQMGEYGLIASDIAAFVAMAIREVVE